MKTDIVFNKDFDAKSIFVSLIYPAEVATIWDYFTKPELLDQWWAPKPWRCETETLDFREGGNWKYAMVGPENERHYAGANYEEIMNHRSISWSDYFIDSDGKINSELPSANWLIGFTGVEEGTKLTVNIYFNSEVEMKEILEMGFEEGFKMGLNQLKEEI